MELLKKYQLAQNMQNQMICRVGLEQHLAEQQQSQKLELLGWGLLWLKDVFQ
jgi:hypothetical protein